MNKYTFYINTLVEIWTAFEYWGHVSPPMDIMITALIHIYFLCLLNLKSWCKEIGQENLDDVGFVFTSTLHSKCQTRCVRNVTTNHVMLTSQQYWLCDIHKIKWPNHRGREAGLWPSGNHFSLGKMCIFQPVRNIFLRLQCCTFSNCTAIGLRVSVCKKTRITICNVLATKSIARVCNLQEQLLKVKGTDVWP